MLALGAASTVTLAVGLVAAAPAASAATTDVVNPASSDWFHVDTRVGGTLEFTDDFDAPSGFGEGALGMRTDGTSNAKVTYFTGEDAGLLLSAVESVSYSSYRSSTSSGNPIQIPTAQFRLDPDGPAGPLEFAPLVFEPYYSYGNPANDVWQSWDGIGEDGDVQWWSNRALGSIPAFTYVPLSDFQAAVPDATITAYGFNLGSGNPNIVSAVDALTINDKTFDFEMLDAVVVDDDGQGALGDCDAEVDAFSTVQAAVDFASAGDTVNVCAGSYTENITVNKQLTFLGAQADNDARVGRTEAEIGAESVIHGYLNANGVSGTTIDGFWFTDSPSNVSIGLYNGTSGHTVINNVIADNDETAIEAAIIYTADGTAPTLFAQNRVTGGDQHGFFATPEASNVTIRDNDFAGNGSSVVHFAPAVGVSSGVVVTGNTSTGDGNFIVGSGVNNLTVTSNTVTGTTGTGMLFGGDFSNVTLSDNTVTGSNGTGISMTSQFGAANTGFTITENTLTGNQRGISFGTGGYTGGAEIHFNRLVGNSSAADGAVGIRNLSAGVIDAEDNWWGCNGGAGATGCDKDLGTVDSTPHLVLNLDVTPGTVTGTAEVTADLTRNSAGQDRSAVGTIPSTPVVFDADKGQLSTETDVLVEGVATVTLSRAGSTGDGTVTAEVDAASVTEDVSFEAPKLSVGNVTVNEAAGNAGFVVTLSDPNDQPVTFDYATESGSASTGDFVVTTGTGTIPPGQLSTTILVPIVQDSADEVDETFDLKLSDGSVKIKDKKGTATIIDDDDAPSVSVSDAEGAAPGTDIVEGANGTFTLTLSAASGQVTRVNVTTKNASAKAPGDFDAVTQTVVFNAGETTKTVTVSTNLDSKTEGDEKFKLLLSKAKKLTIDDKSGVALILANAT